MRWSPKFTPAEGVSVPNEKIQVTARLGGHTEEEIGSLLEQVEAKMPEVKKSLQAEPLLGYIALEAGAAVDMLGHRLVHAKRVDLK